MAQRRAALRDGDRDTYKDLNRRVQSAIRADTRSAIDRQLTERGPAAVWQSMRPVVGPKRCAAPTPSADADALNRYFVEVGVKTARSINRTGSAIPVRLPRVSTGLFELHPITSDQLLKVVSRMRAM